MSTAIAINIYNILNCENITDLFIYEQQVIYKDQRETYLLTVFRGKFC